MSTLDLSRNSLTQVQAPDPIRVRFRDLRVRDRAERAAIMQAIETVLDHGRIVIGPEVAEFERQIASFCRRRHGIGVGSGTDALILGVKALRIGPGDEVITTPLSWLGTGSAILLNGAVAVLCDVDETLNMDPATIVPLITPRTKAILPVHFTGRLARMPEINQIAREYQLHVIEDGAQAFGATLGETPCGAFGDVACISFNPMKVPGGLGDGGVVLCDDDDWAKRIRMLRHSGVVDREFCLALSHNCRLDTIQAAILLKRLVRHPAIVERRRKIACRYDTELAGMVATPPRLPGYRDVFYTYTVRTSRRDDLHRHLTRLGIETRIQHPVLINDQPAFRGKVRGSSPRAASLVQEILCIPAHENLSDDDQSFVIEAFNKFFRGRA
jgi:dTDP-4-amino-4,6-dideoxygalactose transaminase